MFALLASTAIARRPLHTMKLGHACHAWQEDQQWLHESLTRVLESINGCKKNMPCMNMIARNMTHMVINET